MLDLRAIFEVEDPKPLGRKHAVKPDDFPMPWRIEWEERAAIKQYHGGMSREQAEAEALQEIAELMRKERKNGLGS